MEMWLRTSVGGAGDTVLVEIEGEPTGAELVDALVAAGALRPVDRGRLRIVRSGRPVDVADDLSSLGLRSGDQLSPDGRSPEPPPPGTVEVVVASGPAAGARAVLDGPVTVGRGVDVTLPVLDPALSRQHLAIERVGDDVVVRDLDSRNGTFVQGERLGGPRVLRPGEIVEAGRSALRIEAVDPAGPGRLPVRQGRVDFNRAPRLAAPAAPRPIELRAAPERPQRQRIPLVTALAPLLLVPVFLVAGFGGVALVALLAMSPVLVLASYLEDRQHGGKDHREASARFLDEVAQAQEALRTAVPEELVESWRRQPDPAELLARAAGPEPTLWERRPGDDDYLALRLGWRAQPSAHGYRLPDGGDDDLRRRAQEALDPLLEVPSAPVGLPLAELGAVALVGAPADTGALARWLVLQLAVLHSPRDVRLAVLAADGPGWRWAGRLPHVDGEDGRVVTADRTQAVAALTLLAAEAERRATRHGPMGEAPAARGPDVVVVVDDDLDIPRSTLTPIVELGPAVGIRVLWLGHDRRAAPGACRGIVEVDGTTAARTTVGTGTTLAEVTVDEVPAEAVDEAAWALSGLRDASTRDRTAEIPARADLAEVLSMAEPTVAALVDRWSAASGLAAPIGLTGSGIRQLDLRADGPHALLGGTTGAGKSELLQTLVVSLAAHHPPERLTFLLVDYKGGAAFKDCVDLPHTVGYVTDLDGHLVTRALVSLDAELSHRERRLAEVGAKDLVEMERIDPMRAPPSLVLVVDEFAALATELPDFVAGVVNIAQRGRSLGIHLVLATQRPAGAINDNIRANTNLRMSLRMNDAADSEDVIGSDLAAALPRTLPGRAYLRTGATELTEVQVAYSGGHSFGAARGSSQVTVRSGGRVGHSVRRAPEDLVAEPDQTDLQQLVAVIAEAHRARGGQPPRRPWLPALPALVTADELGDPAGPGVPIGWRDEPRRQHQEAEVVDLATDGGLLVVGATGAGKTTLLRTLAVGLATRHGPDDLHLYALDFASRGLRPLAGLPQCGGVIFGDEPERATRLLGTVDRWLEDRRRRFGEASVTSLAELQALERAEGRPPTPRVVVLLDGYGAFSQVFEGVEYGRWLERLPLLVAEGRSLGVHWAVTADRRLTLSSALVAAIDTRYVLRLADVDEYESFGLDRRAVEGTVLPPGRCYTTSGDEVQVAVVGAAGGDAQLEAVTAVAAELAARHPDAHVPPVQLLPEAVDAAGLPAAPDAQHPLVGLDDTDLAPIGVDLGAGDLLVAGPPRSGKSTALVTLVRSLRDADPDARFVLVAPRATPLRDLDGWAERFGTGYEDEERLEALVDQLRDGEAEPGRLIVVVDDAHELIDTTVDEHLEALARHGRDADVHVLVAADRTAAHRVYGGVVARVKGDRQGLLLQPDVDADGDLLGVDLDRRHGGGPPGRGILVHPRGAVRVQVATWEAIS